MHLYIKIKCIYKVYDNVYAILICRIYRISKVKIMIIIRANCFIYLPNFFCRMLNDLNIFSSVCALVIYVIGLGLNKVMM